MATFAHNELLYDWAEDCSVAGAAGGTIRVVSKLVRSFDFELLQLLISFV